jgi:uncharacterized protein with ATP-grasp and redox domains
MPKDEGKTPQNAAQLTGPAHQQVMDAHNKYFQDLASIWNSTQQRFQNVQTEFEREVEKAAMTQDPNAFQTAQTEYQRRFQDACMDANPVGSYEDAYRDYKSAVQNAITAANVDDLNFTDIAHLSQSLYAVSQMAMMMRMTGPTLSGQSPFPKEGVTSPPSAPR